VRIEIPQLCLVALIGVSGSGKSTFAKEHFLATETLSSDYFRGMVSDDVNDQSATADAFSCLYYVAERRLAAARLTVIDATNVQKHARSPILELAKRQNVQAVAIVLNMPEKLCAQRNEQRNDRAVPITTLHRQTQELSRSLRGLQKEGFRRVFVLSSPEEARDAEIVRVPSYTDKRGDAGPFDIIGDVHGCFDELCELFEKLGYTVDREALTALSPEGRRAVFVGDLCDRGPRNADTLRLVMNMCAGGQAYCVNGNHDAKLLKKLRGSDVQLTHGLALTVSEIDALPEQFAGEARVFLDSLVSHYVFDGGKLVVAHAGIPEKYIGRTSGAVRNFCLYGDTTGETDEYGLPVRLPWAQDYRGRAKIVFGHSPSVEPVSVNNTVNIDTGCVFGGRLTAFRYPENEYVQVQAKQVYYEPAKPLAPQREIPDNLLDIRDVSGRRLLLPRLLPQGVTLSEERAASSLEIMSRFAADPRWLIYLPPTMSPCETSELPDYLEHPLEAFSYYRKNGVDTVVCERKHMGSRCVIVVCRDEKTAAERFGIEGGGAGVMITRTGRHFFDDGNVPARLLGRLRDVLESTGFFDDFSTGWVCLDTELMPWSAKAIGLIETQYAPVGRAGRGALASAVQALRAASEAAPSELPSDPLTSGQNLDLKALLACYERKREDLERYTDAYRQYCWSVSSDDDYRIAPFHILASEGKVWNDTDHLTQMDLIGRYMTGKDPVFLATDFITVKTDDDASVRSGVDWWLDLTKSGGEGMVVKPLHFIAKKGSQLLQPAVKCRGREYLRIIYGPEYLAQGNLSRLRKRSLGGKRRLALQEFALGMESLERFVHKEPLYKVHECVFGVLALESEPVDPRL